MRLGEYDASGFKFPEKQNFTEISVAQIIKHPQFSSRRLSFDATVLILQEEIKFKHHPDTNFPVPTLSRHVNTACLPLCETQFTHVFSNGSGAMCWLSGWRVNRDSHVFHPLMSRDLVTLLPDPSCVQDIRKRMASNSFNPICL